MRKTVEKLLAKHARRLLAKTKPEIIAITGSVGKSSTKEAIAAVLAKRFSVRSSPGNYNTEIGLPLAVLGLKQPGRSFFGWMSVINKACWRSCFGAAVKDYPRTLVLEMAADKPGDIAYLTGIAVPDIAVVTVVGESHAERFGSVEGVAKEKRVLVERLKKEGIAVLNRDDEKIWAMREKTKARVVSFGFHESADVRGSDVAMSVSDDDMAAGTRFKVMARGSTVPMFLPGVLGKQAVYAALAAAAVALEKGMNLVEVAEALRGWQPAPGRMRALSGIKKTLLIDDTYNASPTSAKAALEALRDLPFESDAGHAKFAVLGDMFELGPLSVSGHEEVGRAAFTSGAEYLIFVGEKMGDAERAAKEAGAPADRIFHFRNTDEAGRFVQERMKTGDVVLVKGSRGTHMEAVVKELMADPMRAEELLVR